ncbi:MAG: hypothetical protein QOI30_2403 [Mycobacterium sp.]|jgi:hypothetical protein|nr:hypothetical protein [Mycobacterium sp.]
MSDAVCSLPGARTFLATNLVHLEVLNGDQAPDQTMPGTGSGEHPGLRLQPTVADTVEHGRDLAAGAR